MVCSAKSSGHVDYFDTLDIHFQAIASEVISGSLAVCQGSRARQQHNELDTQRTRRDPPAEQAGTFSAVTDAKKLFKRAELAPASRLGPGVLCETQTVMPGEQKTAQTFIGIGRSLQFICTPVSRIEESAM